MGKEVSDMVAANYDREGASEGHKGLMLLFGPIVGLAYVVALPFIGIGMIASLVVGRVFEAAERLFGSVVHFGWRPDEAYLAGKKKKAQGKRAKK